MFTGIVQGLCEVVAVDHEPNLNRLHVDLGDLAEDAALGASIAINGTCLTVTGARGNGNVVSFDVISETLNLTNLGDQDPGGRVNIERSLKFGDEIGGHLVSGHITTAVTVHRIAGADNERELWFDCPSSCLKYLNHKGFVALDGASLTISAVDRDAQRFAVSLIPETIARTTLGTVQVGDRVNVEIDAQTQTIVETVERVMAERLADEASA